MRINWMVTLLLVTQLIVPSLTIEAQEGSLFENFTAFLDLMETKEASGEVLTEEEMIEYFGEEYEYLPIEEDGVDLGGLYNYSFGEGDDSEYITFREDEEGNFSITYALIHTGDSVDEWSQLSTAEYLEWAYEFIEQGETNLESLMEEHTLESISYLASFIEDDTIGYVFDGVTVEYIRATNAPRYFIFSSESDDVESVEYTRAEAEALYSTLGLHLDDVVEVAGNDWVIFYEIETQNLSYNWTVFLDEMGTQDLRVSVDQAGNVLHFLYSDHEGMINGVIE